MSSTTTTIRPVELGLNASFGFGDRLGMATPGHLAALKRAGGSILGIFAQQSIREMARTKRTAEQVMHCAVQALTEAQEQDDSQHCGCRCAKPQAYSRERASGGAKTSGASGASGASGGGWGADADHLKTHADVDYTADAGFTFFTIDPSEHVDQKADSYDPRKLEELFNQVKDHIDWLDDYRGKTMKIPGCGAIVFDELVVRRAAVKYGRAIAAALDMADYIQQAAARRGQPYEIELSVDETDQPTTLAEHYIIADRMRQAKVKLVSLAPRFIGELEKGVDYKGDPRKLEQSLKEHAAVARHLGPYKLSLHSGSDKLSMYEMFARATGGLFHVKTAGTSYLEALRAVARHDEKLFRRIIDFSRGRYDTDKATYHVSATVAGVAPPDAMKDPHQLEQTYLECWDDVPRGKGFTAPGRQILHCTFGSVLTHEELGPAVHQVLREHPATYTQILADHFARHLEALTAGM